MGCGEYKSAMYVERRDEQRTTDVSSGCVTVRSLVFGVDIQFAGETTRREFGWLLMNHIMTSLWMERYLEHTHFCRTFHLFLYFGRSESWQTTNKSISNAQRATKSHHTNNAVLLPVVLLVVILIQALLVSTIIYNNNSYEYTI
jgi:hypothetical protein